MRGRTHSLGGALAALSTCLLIRPAPVIVAGMTVTAFVAAPWPDLDNLGTWSRRVKLGRGPVARHIIIRKHPFKRAASWIVTRWGSHRRGPAHSLAGGVIAAGAWAAPAAILTWWPLWLPAGVLIGWWSHLFLDLLNDRPVALFWPHPALVHGLPPSLRCRVGGKGEIAWTVVIVAGLAECVLHIGWA